jgi:hypothetical protein
MFECLNVWNSPATLLVEDRDYLQELDVLSAALNKVNLNIQMFVYNKWNVLQYSHNQTQAKYIWRYSNIQNREREECDYLQELDVLSAALNKVFKIFKCLSIYNLNGLQYSHPNRQTRNLYEQEKVDNTNTQIHKNWRERSVTTFRSSTCFRPLWTRYFKYSNVCLYTIWMIYSIHTRIGKHPIYMNKRKSITQIHKNWRERSVTTSRSLTYFRR